MLTPEQVVKSLDAASEDADMQAAVRLEQEEQSQQSQQQQTDAAVPTTAVSAEATAEIEELKERIRNLESSILRSEDAIKDVRVCFWMSHRGDVDLLSLTPFLFHCCAAQYRDIPKGREDNRVIQASTFNSRL